MIGIDEAAVLLGQGQRERAVAACKAVLQRDGESAQAVHLLGLAALREGDCRRAVHLIELAVELTDRPAPMLVNLGAAHEALGEFSSAESSYRDALRAAPELCEAFYNLANVRKHADDESLLPAIRQLAGRTDIEARRRSLLAFAAGKICNDRGEYDAAFGHFRAANALAGKRFDLDAHREAVAETIAVFDRSFFAERSGRGCASEIPVFVVGMPRSGTSLVEQVLASHPAVHGAGELYDVDAIARTLPGHTPDSRPFPRCMRELDPALLARFGEAYVRRVRSLAPSAQRIVDKMPGNFQLLGLIAALLPHARIVHCRRHPLDTCLSCYFQHFSRGVPYAYDLGHLAGYYRSYVALMAHWREVLPAPLLELDYEALVEDLEGSCRRLVEFCGLEWDARCLEFHKAPRAVRTASSWQVRQPLYTTSVGRWRHYEKHLQPLRQGLGL